ncbi:L,D-transpeptidase [Pseudonocardia nigra]|uniref:L,D-transpeptidase n=1 Tax=Pseudonocardia nigra TaxID=1921578 RepID=UPI001C5FBDA4|nr:L,D-transpeptidase [Pseudonocardia nigra]
MGKHSRTARPRVRMALAAGIAGIGAMASVGTAHAQGPAMVEGTPCTAVARACVDLAAGTAWLVDNGKIARGPVPISSGGPGNETPRGDFRVEWKNVNHRSAEFDNAPMPFSVFFAQGGIAFHEGRLDTPSAGCVRLARADAIAFFDFLAVDDPVQVR